MSPTATSRPRERTFILADTPGHVQYTRNTVTGASTADVAVILVDARSGVVEQTKRHAAVAALLRVGHVVLAVNKMDLVDYAEDVFDASSPTSRPRRPAWRSTGFTPIPVAALVGDNVVERSTRMDWYTGPSLLEYLEGVTPRGSRRRPRPVPGAGRDPPADGRVPGLPRLRRPGRGRHRWRVGDKVVVLPGGRTTTIVGIDTPDGELATRRAGPVGDAAAGRRHRHRPRRPDRGRPRPASRDGPRTDRDGVLAGARAVAARRAAAAAAHDPPGAWPSSTRSQSRLDVAHADQRSRADELGLNDIGTIRLRTAEPVMVDPYEVNRSTGRSCSSTSRRGATVSAGMVARFYRRDRSPAPARRDRPARARRRRRAGGGAAIGDADRGRRRGRGRRAGGQCAGRARSGVDGAAARRSTPADVAGAWLVFACTDDTAVNASVSAAAAVASASSASGPTPPAGDRRARPRCCGATASPSPSTAATIRGGPRRCSMRSRAAWTSASCRRPDRQPSEPATRLGRASSVAARVTPT